MSTTEQVTGAVDHRGEVTTGGPPPRLRRRWLGVVAAVTLAVAAAVAGVFVSAAAWGADLHERGALLPGTTIAGVDVGGMTTPDALAAVGEVFAAPLGHEIEVRADGSRWTIGAGDLGAETDAAGLVAAAVDRAGDTPLLSLVAMRWFGAGTDLTLEPAVTIPDTGLEGFVDGVTDEVDRSPQDATIAWDDGAVAVTSAADGFAVDRGPALEVVRAAFLDEATEPVELPHDILRPEVGDDVVTAAADAARAALDGALGHEVVLRHGEAAWTTSPAELDATPHGDEVVESAFAAVRDGADPSGIEVAFTVPDAAVHALLARIAGEVDVAAVNATVDYADGAVRRIAGRQGVVLDRDAAADALGPALRGGADEVELAVDAVRPARGVAALRDVLVLHQSQRTVELHRDDEVIRSWPVAVGTGGSPTPTGVYVVGAKRAEPTWVNPAPDRWGADMPARIGPGPDNPLGLRALNWNRDGGGDTLIRFHGTPNEDSIGEAASNGCVRMFNDDVVELFDLVASGTMIISRA